MYTRKEEGVWQFQKETPKHAHEETAKAKTDFKSF